jgi:hypothetical protein
LGNVEMLPTELELNAMRKNPEWQEESDKGQEAVHLLAKRLLMEGKVDAAWKVLLA